MPSEASSDSLSLYEWTYDVFISYRRSDTGHNFTGLLYNALRDKGIRTVIDDDEGLQIGHEITPELLEAIQSSRIAIVVFSKNYAFSPFCLELLAQVIELHERFDGMVAPVFYDVDPFHVRSQKGTYAEAMAMHEVSFKEDMSKVQRWKSALSEAANLVGWNYEHGDVDIPQHEFITRIVEEISRRINRVPWHLANHPVGLESRVRDVFSLLSLETDEVCMVGIYGMGGIGKTTLARAVYNSIADQFEGSCFLDAVWENSKRHGLVHLQNTLLTNVLGEKDVHLTSVSEGISRIKHRLGLKKILLILDDVSHLEQLEALAGTSDWFGYGSKIIITTRDRNLLTFHGIERKYEVGALNDTDALELFSRKAFKDHKIDPNFLDISKQVLTYASGVPLTLAVIGAYFFGKGIEEWKSALHRLQRIPNSDIQDILQISFHELDAEEKSVFLDIACCFNGYSLTDIEDILCAHHGSNMKHHIGVLVEKSFISISLDGKVILHPLMEDMGKEIVRLESPQEPGRRSRLWFFEDIIQVLQKNTGTSKIEIIHMSFPLSPLSEEEEIKWDGEAFKKMENLRTLIIRNGRFSQGPKYLPNSLRVLEWRGYPSKDLPSDFDSKKLPIFKITKSPNKTIPRAEMTWKLVGLTSSVVGLSCYALSPSFNRLIGGWNVLKLSLYLLLSMAICATMLFGKQYSTSGWYVRLNNAYMGFAAFVMISVYTFFYERAVNGKPEILSLISNAAFAVMSLSLSKLIKFRFETGVFCSFLGCLTIQLATINLKLILVAIIFDCPLFLIHFSSDSHAEIDIGSESLHSSLDSQPAEVGNDAQHAIDIITT